MKVLIACEFSGIVREEFRKLGHDAWSCDLLPTEIPGNHIQDNVLNILNDGWDLMIAHPPCQDLSVSGAVFWKEKQKDGRQQRAIDFFLSLVNAPIEKICVENPAGIISTVYRKPDQYVQPWWFGHMAQKRTGLWLKNLPLLVPTDIVDRGEIYKTKNGKSRGGSWHMKLPPSEERWKIRSRTFTGVAKAMATQWSLNGS